MQAIVTKKHALVISVLALLFVTGLGGWRALRFSVGALDSKSRVALLRPETWLGERCPLLGVIKGIDGLDRGRWSVLLYNRGCTACLNEIATFEERAERAAGSEASRYALVDVSGPEERILHELASPASRCALGQLSDLHDWFVKTPAILGLRDGVVVSVKMPDAESTSGGSTRTFRGVWKTVLASSPLGDSAAHGFPNYRQLRREHLLKEMACGPLAVIAVMNHLNGTSLAPEAAEAILTTGAFSGTNFLQLKNLLESHGLHVLGVDIEASQLKKLGYPAIVHINDTGFAGLIGLLPIFRSMWYESLTARMGRRTLDATEASFAGTDRPQAA